MNQRQEVNSLVLEVNQLILEEHPSFKVTLEEFSNKGFTVIYDTNQISSFLRLKFGKNAGEIIFDSVPIGEVLMFLNKFISEYYQIVSEMKEIDRQFILNLKNCNDFTLFVGNDCDKCYAMMDTISKIALLNQHVTLQIIDYASFENVNQIEIFGLPTTFLNQKEFAIGKLSLSSLLCKLGTQQLREMDTSSIYDVVILGGGPAGISAAIYSARKGLKVGMVYDSLGGQVNDIHLLETVAGVPEISGCDLVEIYHKQLMKYPIVHFSYHKVVSIDYRYDFISLLLENDVTIKTRSLILATGAKRSLMEIEGEQQYLNKGISFCAHCDGPIYKNKTVVVTGGGNEACQSALVLSEIAKKVIILEMSKYLTADRLLLDQIDKRHNIKVLCNRFLYSIEGNGHVESISIMNHLNGESEKISTDGIFVMGGFTPNTDFTNKFLELDERGKIIVNELGQTNLPNIFAAGNCTNKKYNQVAISIGDGATAALTAHEYLLLHT